MRTTIPIKSPVSRNRLLACALIPAAFFAVALIGTGSLVAQTPAAHPASSAAHKATRKHPRTRAVQPVAPAQAAPAAPELPHWPVNDRPAPATVTWDSRGLHIDATNASLQQILREVTTATGVKVEGMGADERVFGDYGPGQARDVLFQLLHGSGYNVLMIGDQGQGTPRRVVLTSRGAGGAPSAPNVVAQDNADDDADYDASEVPQPPPPPPVRTGFPPGQPQRPEQQTIPEMQQRQQTNAPRPQ